jgi:hypothetical protein
MSALRLQESSAQDEASTAWRWRVYVVGPEDVVARIERVEYILPTTFPSPVRVVEDRVSAFALEGITWDDFECVARVHVAGEEPEVLRRSIRLARDDDAVPATIDVRPGERRRRPPIDVGHGSERLTRSVLIYLGLVVVLTLLLLAAALADVVLPMRPEQRLLLVAVFAGAAGASIEALQAVLANAQGVSRAWLRFFLLRPFIGMLVAALIYLVVRGGFFTSSATPTDINAAGVAITGFIAGFSSARLTSRAQRTMASMFAVREAEAAGSVERGSGA